MLATYPVLGHVLVFRRYTETPPSARCIPMRNYSRSCNLGSSVIETLQAVSCFLVLSVGCCLVTWSDHMPVESCQLVPGEVCRELKTESVI